MIDDTVIPWETATDIIKRNQLDKLYRNHAITNKYRTYKQYLQETNSSLADHLVRISLKWIDEQGNKDIKPKGKTLFSDPSDAKIILNDFPYNFESGITHLCVWSKVSIESDPKSPIGDITEDTRRVINKYVNENFVKALELEEHNVIWFRNFPAIQSVVELSHIHILLNGLEKGKLEKILGTAGVVLDSN